MAPHEAMRNRPAKTTAMPERCPPSADGPHSALTRKFD